MRTLGLILLACGLVALGFGINSSQALTEQVVEGVSGRYTENTMLYIFGGIAMIIGGGALAYSSKRN